MLIVVVITSGVVVVGSMVGFQQNSSPVPQCPNTEQHSPISWLQSESEAHISGGSVVVGAGGIVDASLQYSGPTPQ